MNPFAMPPTGQAIPVNYNVNANNDASQELSWGEKTFGFDAEFAARVKNIWTQMPRTRDVFKTKLDALQNRYSISLFLEGAWKSESGLGKTLAKQFLVAGSCFLFANLTYRANAPAPVSIGAVLAGIVIPTSIFCDRVKIAKQQNFDRILQKLEGRLSPLDCKRLSKAFEWAAERRVQFDMNNDRHLQGHYA